MKNLKLLLLLCVVVISCSPAKRLERLVSRNPSLVSTDTIYSSDTTIVDAVRADTSFIFSQLPSDTFYLDRDRLMVRVIRSTDTLLINAECKADTIIKEIPVQVNTVQPVEQLSLFKKIGIGFLLCCVVFCVAWSFVETYHVITKK